MSYRTDEKHQQQEHVREEEKKREKLHERQGVRQMRIIHPGWILVFGFALIFAVLAAWLLAFS